MRRRRKELEGPRAGIALFWFFPIDDREKKDPLESMSPEEVERLESLTGIEMRDLLARLQELAVEFRREPEALQAHLKRLARGNEVFARTMTDILRSYWEDDDEDVDADIETESGDAEVLDFEPTSDVTPDDPTTDDDKTP